MTYSYGKTLMGRTVKTSAQVEHILGQQIEPTEPQPAEQVERAVLFTDIVGSTAYFERHGDKAGLAMVERHNRLLFPLVTEHQGIIIKTIGDAIMAGFISAAPAVLSAVAMQQRLKQHNQNQPQQERITVRIGINYGSVLCRSGDLFGDVVNAAARVESLARGGQILISTAVEQQLVSSFQIQRSLFDAVRIKGKQEPVEVYEVGWDPGARLQVADKSARLEPGTLLGNRFEIKASLGEGGMGQVYQAFDHALGETVALKFIRPDRAATPDALDKLKSEIRLARAITHPNICRIHEFLEMQGMVFMSMERVQGQTLEDLLEKQGCLNPEQAVSIASGICQGLQAAHDRGIIHRDLKPANVMIEDETQRVILMDFGIAQLGRAGTSQNGSIEGTPEYMSPEQVSDQQVSTPSDIYSLGVILYEILSGKPPHVANTPVAVAIRHLTEEPEPLENIRPDLPQRLTRAIHRCLFKQPDRRFKDPSSLMQALGAKKPDHKTSWLIAVSIALGLAVTAFMVIWLLSSPSGPAAHAWNPRVLISNRSVDSHARISPDGQRVAFFRNKDIWSLGINDDPRQITSSSIAYPLEDLGGLSWSTDGSKIFFTAVNLANPEVKQVEHANKSERSLLDRAAGADLSPDGAWLAFSQPNRHAGYDLAISHPDGSDRQILLRGAASHSFLQPRWSPDSKQLVFVKHQTGFQSTRDIGVAKLEGSKFKPITSDGIKNKAYNTDPTWTPDGKWILYASKRAGVMSLWQVPASGGPSTPLMGGAIHHHREPDMYKDAKRIVFSTREEQMDIAYIDSGGHTNAVTQDVWTDRFPIFSLDGKQVAFRTQRSSGERQPRSIVLYDLTTHLERQVAISPGARDFCWCGSSIFYAATLDEKRLLGRVDTGTGASETLIQDFYRLWSPACNENDLRVVFVGQQSKKDSRALWLLEGDLKTLRRLSQNGGVVSYPAFSPNGRYIAYRWAPSGKRLGESELRIVSVRSGARPRMVTKDRSFQRSQRRIRFSKDGRRLFYMEAIGKAGRLLSIDKNGGPATPLSVVNDIHTFDFDMAPDGKSLVYARVLRHGDIYLLERAD